ncbi:GNAT family N-acetyltransferase [Glaciimonas soli]|uniref:GNAT family N-acetyltransferase n=1 Tax=Glaciimonas soli TaxID=2590999 RepID=A0A843YWB4_9BURK|nr:GNAT family N-acetyltransferase [Glaciimonas soli]MQR01522.1 GNAT family N-acetyltransferase [Glaciimonas soli]
MDLNIRACVTDLETSRLHLRRFQSGDEDALFREYCGDAESSKYLQREVHSNIDQTKKMLDAWCNIRWSDKSPGFAWVISYRETNMAIGIFLICFEGGTCEIHFGIGRRFWGKGLMTEAAGAGLLFLEQSGCFERIWTACDIENIGAHRVLAKLGLQQEALLEKWFVLPSFGDKARDCFRFSRVYS